MYNFWKICARLNAWSVNRNVYSVVLAFSRHVSIRLCKLLKVVFARKSPARTTLFKGVNFHWPNDRKRARKSQPTHAQTFFSSVVWHQIKKLLTARIAASYLSPLVSIPQGHIPSPNTMALHPRLFDDGSQNHHHTQKYPGYSSSKNLHSGSEASCNLKQNKSKTLLRRWLGIRFVQEKRTVIATWRTTSSINGYSPLKLHINWKSLEFAQFKLIFVAHLPPNSSKISSDKI